MDSPGTHFEGNGFHVSFPDLLSTACTVSRLLNAHQLIFDTTLGARIGL